MSHGYSTLRTSLIADASVAFSLNTGMRMESFTGAILEVGRTFRMSSGLIQYTTELGPVYGLEDNLMA
jgi:hypothetical protein